MKTPFILSLLAATMLAPAPAIAKDTIAAKGAGHGAQANPGQATRTFTPPRSTAARALVGGQSRRARGADRQDRGSDARRRHRRETRGDATHRRAGQAKRERRAERRERRRDRRAERRHERQETRRDHRRERRAERRHERRAERRHERREARRDHRRDARRAWQHRYTKRRDQYRRWRNFHQRSHWNRNWRARHRYAWRDYRARNRYVFRLPRYYAPRDYDYGYRRFSAGLTIGSVLYQQRYWIDYPGRYRLPSADGPYRWVRYYNDALLVDIRSGYVADVIHDIFW